tara:strand:- start:104 stop:403 length:300 start_codon:yes stop_codon:yes gene_type:complete
MANPIVHALVLMAAIIIPGGLLVYFAWRAARAGSISSKANLNQNDDLEPFEYIPENLPDPEECREAFRRMYPTHSPDSLRAKSRVRRLMAYKNGLRKKS